MLAQQSPQGCGGELPITWVAPLPASGEEGSSPEVVIE